jgi:hypothetical protein
MTRTSGTYRIGYRAGSPSPTPIKRTVKPQPYASLEVNRVSDQPIEEVVFEPENGVDQRAQRRGFAVSEIREEVLTEQVSANRPQRVFWQGFSTPFMAQVIGQSQGITRTVRPSAYNQNNQRLLATQSRLSKAC